LADLGPGEPAWPTSQRSDDPAKRYATPRELRGTAFRILAAVFAAAAVAVTAADVANTASLTWSRYPLAALAAVLAGVAATLAWHRTPALWAGAWFVLTTAFLAAVDAFSQGGWFATLGLPVTASSFALCALGIAWGRKVKRKGYNLFGLFFGLGAIELMILDALITWETTGRAAVGWSTVTALVLVPLALLFILLHAALPRTPDLRRIFHF
jgi:hypothetical protein